MVFWGLMGSVVAAGAMPPIRVSRSVTSIRSTYRPVRRRGRLPKAREPVDIDYLAECKALASKLLNFEGAVEVLYFAHKCKLRPYVRLLSSA